MPTKKVKRSKFRYNINRKKLNKKHKRTPNISCEHLKKEWDDKQTFIANMRNMGLASDPNISLKIPDTVAAPLRRDEDESEPEETTPVKIHVAKALEEDAKAPRRERAYRLPDSQVRWITYYLDKYGEDYKAMTRDSKNYDQLTWKQFRRHVNKFKDSTEQYNEYFKSREQKEMVVDS